MYGEDITRPCSQMGLNLSQAGPQVPEPLAVLAKATRGAAALDCLALPCPGLLPSGLSRLPPTSHLCQVPQGLLQPLALLCVQGGLLLELQGFLESW